MADFRMPVHPEWPDIVLRLLCTAVAGFVLGFDRGEHGRPAGLRTSMLVAMAACVAMIQANLLMPTNGKAPDSFVVLDLMRLPLGILSGMGFIGAGAIVRRDNIVPGVTTAATLWFITVMGLCFGGGQFVLGSSSLVAAFIILSGLRRFEKHLRQDRHATLTVTMAGQKARPQEVRSLIETRFGIVSCAVVCDVQAETQELTYKVSWRGQPSDTELPEVVLALAGHSDVLKVNWLPEPV
jgi:putative Mg2+ transporter-C (MgtC) family protein